MDSVFTDYNLPKELGIETLCLICGEPVQMEHMGDRPKICDKCKEAVMIVRKKIDKIYSL